MTPDKTPTEALAQLRHLYVQLKSQDGMSRADRSRIADGLLSPAIAALEKWGQPAQAAEPVAVVVPCYTPSGKRVALCSAKQDLPIGTKLYAAPQPSHTAQAAESVPAVDRNRIREIFMAHGFTVKEGQTDLKQYVYDAADALLRAASDPAISVQEDAALWRWLAEYLVGTRTDLDDEIVASETVNDLRKLVEAAIKQGATQ